MARAAAEAVAFEHPRAAPLLLGLVVFCLTYLALQLLGAPLFYYLPEQRAFALAAPAGVIAMDYYGLVLGALGGFALGYTLGWLAPIRRALARRTPARILVWVAGLVVGGALAFELVAQVRS